MRGDEIARRAGIGGERGERSERRFESFIELDLSRTERFEEEMEAEKIFGKRFNGLSLNG